MAYDIHRNHNLKVATNCFTANGATADDAINAPLAKEAATGGNVAGDPSSTPVYIFHRCVNVRICEQLCKKKINAKICGDSRICEGFV